MWVLEFVSVTIEIIPILYKFTLTGLIFIYSILYVICDLKSAFKLDYAVGCMLFEAHSRKSLDKLEDII